ncbi:cytochrome c oxidase subunit 3 family protein [Oleomonas cavernae]|uniref:Cytochrome c oxidase subunit 3 family protein n=2 Tax=Oleomonas cavernae TaxID=2320859 RepID=A0A418WH68_9PROT|nr:cytochrome c oxidase subunit 3 family protein [Oleomonas cavernae]
MFLSADIFMFGLFFLIFIFERAQAVTLFEQSRLLLDPWTGLLNTFFLLTSSWFMVGAVEAAREGRAGRLQRYLVLSFAAGSGFGVLKMTEYVEKIRGGISMLTNDFFMYYFVFTGVHFLHYLVGMAVLALVFFKVRGRPAGPGNLIWVESTACYWHMVDLLWLMLFPLLYLLRA